MPRHFNEGTPTERDGGLQQKRRRAFAREFGQNLIPRITEIMAVEGFKLDQVNAGMTGLQGESKVSIYSGARPDGTRMEIRYYPPTSRND